MNVGDIVRIVEDEYPQLVGLEVEIIRIGPDGTTAWVSREGADGISGVWCALSNLEPVQSM